MTTLLKTDTQIRRDVIDEIERDWRFEPAELGVEVDAGVVTLDGTVSTYEKLLAAAEIAAAIAGVKGVANKLTVRPRGAALRDDTQLASSIRRALVSDPVVPDERIELIVRDGVATLGGTVPYMYQRRAAADSARRIDGVDAVRDNIQVAWIAYCSQAMRREIESALVRRIPAAARRIRVEVKEGVVTLTGSVQFFTERLQAEKAAWMTEAVRNVINNLTTTW